MAGYDVSSAAGLYAGSQTISASMGLATDAINRLGLSPDETKKLLDAMPVAYAVTYIFGTIGSAIVLALIGPALLGIDLEAACKRYEEKHGGKKEVGRARHGLAPVRVARVPRQGRRACCRQDVPRGRGADSRISGCSCNVSGADGQIMDATGRYRDPGRRRRRGGRPARRAGEA